MKILHVFSSDFFSGAVEHVIELAKQQRDNGDEVWLMSDAGLEHKVGIYFSQPISKRSPLSRLANILAIRKQIKQLEPDVIHAHSRAASWVAKRACYGKKTALVSTIHGRQHVHRSSKKKNDYGDEIIAVSDSIKSHLIQDLDKSPKQIQVISNGVIFPEDIATKPESLVLSLIGRLNGPKGEMANRLLQEVFPHLLSQYVDLKIFIVGGIVDDSSIVDIDTFNSLVGKFPGRIESKGFVEDIQPIIDASAVIIGAGRVAIKTLASDRFLLALGESEFCGLVTDENYETVVLSNFGDTGEKKTWEASEVLLAFQQTLTISGQSSNLAKRVRTDFSLEEKCKAIEEVYRKARMRRLFPNWIPILMYHKVPNTPIDSPHRIFVTRKNFKKHLKYLQLFQRTPICFQDYFSIRNGTVKTDKLPKRPIVITFDDGYLDNYENALPLLETRGWKATLFALSDRNQTENFWDKEEKGKVTSKLMNSEQLQHLQSKEWEIGVHTFSHSHLPSLSKDDLKREVVDGKIALEKELNSIVIGFAYPYGDFGIREEMMVRKAGYSYAVSTDTGELHLEDNLFRIFRVNVFPEENLFSFWKKTSSWYRAYYFRKRGK